MEKVSKELKEKYKVLDLEAEFVFDSLTNDVTYDFISLVLSDVGIPAEDLDEDERFEKLSEEGLEYNLPCVEYLSPSRGKNISAAVLEVSDGRIWVLESIENQTTDVVRFSSLSMISKLNLIADIENINLK